MGFSMQTGSKHAADFNNNWVKFLLWGIALFILGVIAMSAAAFTTIATIFFLGVILFVGGLIVLMDSITFWRGKPGFALHLLSGLLYTAVGIMLMINPITGSMSLTLLLGIGYTIIGFFRIITALSLQLFRWKLSLFNGILTMLIGILIMASWPQSSLYIIGLFIGIDLIVCGWVYMMSAIAGRNIALRG